MKVLFAICVIYGLLFHSISDCKEITPKDDGDEFSDYADVLKDVVKSANSLFDDIFDGDGSIQHKIEAVNGDNNESDVDFDADDEDSSEESGDILDEFLIEGLEKFFTGTLERLQGMGDEAVSEFIQNLGDLIQSFINYGDDDDENNVYELIVQRPLLITENEDGEKEDGGKEDEKKEDGGKEDEKKEDGEKKDEKKENGENTNNNANKVETVAGHDHKIGNEITSSGQEENQKTEIKIDRKPNDDDNDDATEKKTIDEKEDKSSQEM